MTRTEGTPPRDRRTYLLKFKTGIVCSGSYRLGRMGEPQPEIIDWRCDRCGRFATPVAWCVL